jgi:hypothetical protein
MLCIGLVWAWISNRTSMRSVIYLPTNGIYPVFVCGGCSRWGNLIAPVRSFRIWSPGYVTTAIRYITKKIPYLVDERIAGTTFLQRLNGLVDVPTDREVLMLYTNFMRSHGPGVLWSYGRDAQAVAVGVTGGGVEIEGMRDVPPMTWEELTRDLRLAARQTDHVHVFSLEGCVEQGFLERLQDFDWGGAVTLPIRDGKRMDRMRKLLRVCLRIRAYPLILLLGLFILLWAVPRLVEED